MTAEEFRGKLKALGISQKWLAGRLGVLPGTVNRWAQGTVEVPQYVVFVLTLIERRDQVVVDDMTRNYEVAAQLRGLADRLEEAP